MNLLDLDHNIFWKINHEWTGSVLDLLMAVASSLSFWTIPLALGFVLIAVFGGFRARAMLLALVCAVGLTETVNYTFKRMAGRWRPHQVLEGARVVTLTKTRPPQLALFRAPKVKSSKGVAEGEGRSFPSGHTANNFAALAILVSFYRRNGWWFLPVALLVGYSRIYTGSHWPSDVAFSIAYGLAMGWLTVRILEQCWRMWGNRLAPQWYHKYPTLTPSET